MYPSDYGYAVDNASCARTTNLSNYWNSTDSCETDNWLYKGSNHWTLTSISSNDKSIFNVIYYGYVSSSYANDNNYNGGWGIRPTIYLKSNVSIVDNENDGSIDHPYDLVLS